MNEEIKKRLLSSLDVLQKGIEGVWDFSKQEIPEVIKEFLTYNFYSRLFWGIFWTLVTLAISYGFYRVSKGFLKSARDDEEKTMAVVVPLIMCILFCICPVYKTFSNMDDALKIKLAPRVFLLEQVKDMIKESKPSK